jgi:organic radical activating enzyme
MLPTDILPRIEADNAGLTVVTGGEPLLHQRKPAFSSMIDALARIGDVEIETNGTIPPVKGMPAAFNASVKLASSGVPEALRYRPSAVDALNEAGARFKFVAKDVRDLDEIGHIVDAHHLPHSNIWVMPEGTTAEAVLSGTRRIADDVIRHGWNLTTRLHTIIWGQERAR